MTAPLQKEMKTGRWGYSLEDVCKKRKIDERRATVIREHDLICYVVFVMCSAVLRDPSSSSNGVMKGQAMIGQFNCLLNFNLVELNLF